MSVLFGLLAALAYGASDFIAGVLSRRASFLQVGVVAQCVAMLTTLVALPFTTSSAPPLAAILWGVAGGAGGALGALALYRGLGAGRMAVVAPISGVGAAALPALAGFALGERPSGLAVLGIVLALPAVWLVSTVDKRQRGGTGVGAAVVDGLLAGLGFALLFFALSQAGDGAGLWPVASAHVVASVIMVTIAVLAGASLRPSARVAGGAAAVGSLAAAATVLFFLATHRGLLTLTVVLTSLYPAFTVLLARLTLGERFGRLQLIGLGLAGVAVVLIVAG